MVTDERALKLHDHEVQRGARERKGHGVETLLSSAPGLRLRSQCCTHAPSRGPPAAPAKRPPREKWGERHAETWHCFYNFSVNLILVQRKHKKSITSDGETGRKRTIPNTAAALSQEPCARRLMPNLPAPILHRPPAPGCAKPA